jgi:hypothetical protein
MPMFTRPVECELERPDCEAVVLTDDGVCTEPKTDDDQVPAWLDADDADELSTPGVLSIRAAAQRRDDEEEEAEEDEFEEFEEEEDLDLDEDDEFEEEFEDDDVDDDYEVEEEGED